MVVEGVHVMPGAVGPGVRDRCVLVEALLVVEDADLHRGHFSHPPGHPAGGALPRRLRRDPQAPGPPGRAGPGRGRGGDRQLNVDEALARLMQLVLDAVEDAG